MSEHTSAGATAWRIALEVVMLVVFTFIVGCLGVVLWFTQLLAGWCTEDCNWTMINLAQGSIVYILPALWLGTMIWAVAEMFSRRRTAVRPVLVGGIIILGYMVIVFISTYFGAQLIW